MLWPVKKAESRLRLNRQQVHYLVAMGQIEAVRIGRCWRLLPEAAEDYAKRRDERKTGETAGYFVYPGNGGFLFDTIPGRIPVDPLGGLPAWKDGDGNWCVARGDLKKFCSRNSNL